MKKEIITITKKLISFQTVAPQGNEYLMVNYLKELMEKIGLKTEIKFKDPKRTNVIGTYGKEKPTLIIGCHMDVVAPGEGWQTNPFKAVVKNDKIIGRGAIDDKGPFVVSYLAIRKFIKTFPNFKGKIILVAFADEETDNVYGIKYLIKKKIIKEGCALIPDGGNFYQLDIGEKGTVQIVIESYGKQEHSALAISPQNAILNLSRLINKISTFKWSNNIHPLFSPVQINVSKFHGGEIPNMVCPFAFCQLDIRFPLGLSSLEVIKKIKQIISQTEGKFKLKIIYTTEPHLVKDKKLINLFCQAAKNLKIKITPITLAGNSVAKELNEAGIPAIVHYPEKKISAHEPNEFITISSMIKSIDLYFEFLRLYFFTQKDEKFPLQNNIKKLNEKL
jgi:acetylornithine deacetylase/succinyl-diaminopimelate desuccinylase family protein